ALVVDEAGRHVIKADLGLVALGDPLVLDALAGDVFGAVLDAGVVAGLVAAAEGETKLEVSDGAAGPEEERVALRGILQRGCASEVAVPDGPEARVAIPAGEGFAVKERDHAGRLRRRGLRLARLAGVERRHGEGAELLGKIGAFAGRGLVHEHTVAEVERL